MGTSEQSYSPENICLGGALPAQKHLHRSPAQSASSSRHLSPAGLISFAVTDSLSQQDMRQTVDDPTSGAAQARFMPAEASQTQVALLVRMLAKPTSVILALPPAVSSTLPVFAAAHWVQSKV